MMWTLAAILALSGCSGASGSTAEDEGAIGSAMEALSNADLYTNETFGGNGRTCATCHPTGTGTFSPAEAQARYAADPNDPLFRALDSDDGSGSSYQRLLTHATVLVGISLPPNVKLSSDPEATSATFERGIPSTLDTPALDPVLMADGRAASLEDQAGGAILGHAQAPDAPADKAIAKIVEFEEKLFSSKQLKAYAEGGPAPVLPEGSTDAEKRGRAWFDSSVPSGVCAHCHSGPMLNETNEFNVFSLPAGARFVTAFVSELNPGDLPAQTFLFTNDDGTTTTVTSPDPGRALITGKLSDVNFFKIPTVWNAKNTAPYFHDGSAQTLEELVHHYKNFFEVFTNGGLVLSPQDEADIVAYVKLL
jgi:cytochrome c peroxidase